MKHADIGPADPGRARSGRAYDPESAHRSEYPAGSTYARGIGRTSVARNHRSPPHSVDADAQRRESPPDSLCGSLLQLLLEPDPLRIEIDSLLNGLAGFAVVVQFP